MTYMCKKEFVKHLRDMADRIEQTDEISCNECNHSEKERSV